MRALAVLHLKVRVSVLTHLAIVSLQLLIDEVVGENAFSDRTQVHLPLVAVLDTGLL